MLLTKEEIEELKKNIKIQEIDDELLKEKNYINIKNLFIKVNREVYEDLLLFKYSVDFLKWINYDKTNKYLLDNKGIIDKANGYLTDYKIGMMPRVEILGSRFIEKNNEVISEIVNVVFDNFVSGSIKKKGKSSILDKLRQLREKSEKK